MGQIGEYSYMTYNVFCYTLIKNKSNIVFATTLLLRVLCVGVCYSTNPYLTITYLTRLFYSTITFTPLTR